MHVEQIKTWQWVLIGLLMGAIFGVVTLWKGPLADSESLETVDQGAFERQLVGQAGKRLQAELIRENAKNSPLIKNLTVHPHQAGDAPGVFWVTGKSYTIVTARKDPKDLKSSLISLVDWAPFKYQSTSPYKAYIGAPGVYPNIVGYFRALQAKPDARFTYQYAWWDQPVAAVGLPALAGLLIIGIAWPLTIGLMQRGGLAPVPQPRVRLPKNRKQPAKAKVDTTQGDQQLADLNAQLEAAVADFASRPSDDLEDDDTPAPIKPLTATAPAASAPGPQDQADEITEYGGEFYPVVKQVHHKAKG